MRHCFALLLSSFVLVATPAATQSFEITPFSGWRFGGSVEDFRTGASVDIDDAQSYGLLVSVPIDLGRHVEVMYSNQETELRLALPFNGRQIFDLTIENWMLGVRQDFAEGETVTPFASGLIGVTDAGGRSGESESRFALAFGGGVRVMPPDGHIGLRLDGRIYSTFVSSSSAIACGPVGCVLGFSGSVLWQVEATAGLVIRF